MIKKTESKNRNYQTMWIDQYSAVNYDPNCPAWAGTIKTQLHLNGRGSQQANEREIQPLIDFAETVASKIASQS
jgi:hypothetical protein